MTHGLSRRDVLRLGAVGAGVALLRPPVADAAPTRFRDAQFPITEFGASQDSDCRSAIAAAITACHRAGGGHVVVPPGRWRTGAIGLRSGVDLHVSAGATLAFSTDPSDYLPVVLTRWQGIEVYNYSPLIYAHGERNIGVTGAGVLDAQGDNEHWWYWIGSGQYGWHTGLPNQRADWALLSQMGDNGVPVSQRVFGDGHYLRPSFISPHSCTGVVISGVTLRNSPMWNVHPVFCRDVLVQDVQIDSLGPNGDGCDPDSCEDVTIRRVRFATHDDCIAIKSGRDADGRRVNRPSRRIRVEDCTFVSGGGAIAIGSEMSGGVSQVRGRRLHLPVDPSAEDADIAYVLWVKSTATRGGYVDDVRVTDVDCTGRTYIPFSANFHYTGTGGGDLYPSVSRLHAARWQVGTSTRPYDLEGVADAPIAGVTLEHCSFGPPDQPPLVQYVDRLRLRDVSVGN